MAEEMCANGPGLPLVVVSEELGLVGGHVNADRAFRFAGFARETQVERMFDLVTLPSRGDRLTTQHLEQQVRTTPGRVLFIARDHVARAHRAGISLATLPDADTAQRRSCDAALHGQWKERPNRRWLVSGPAQVLGGPVRVHDLAGIHQAIRIPNLLELPERADERVAEHPRQ